MARLEGGGAERPRGEINSIFLLDKQERALVYAFLNASTYYQFFCVYTDGRHINPTDCT